jgi:hypothetical protein
MEADGGSTVIETNAAVVTASVAAPLMPPWDAVIVVLPVAALCAKPAESTVATAVTLELQVEVLVTS